MASITGGRKLSTGDRLQDVERGDHERLDALVVRRQIAVADGEDQAQHICQEDADDRVERVLRQRVRAQRDHHLLRGRTGPEHRDAHDGVEDREADGRDAQVHDDRPGAAQHLRPRQRLPPRAVAEARVVQRVHSSISAVGRSPQRTVSASAPSFSGWMNRRRGVEVEQLGVPAPADRGLELAQRHLFGELLVQHVVEELLGDAAVALGLDGAHDLAEQQHVVDCRLAEELLLAQDLGVGVLGPRGVISASPSVTVRKPSKRAASTMGSRSSISNPRSSARR
jgi:hypothetical protein